MKFNLKAVCGLACSLCLISGFAANAHAANAYPLFTDPSPGGLVFGNTDVFSFGANYAIDAAAQLNGNQVLAIRQFGVVGGGTGAGVSVPISNGENGIDSSLDGALNDVLNPDIPNATPANSVFTTIGNSSGKLENGNVLRFSAWYRSDPADPITVDPQIQPVMKWEIWKEALSTSQDTNGGQVQPLYGDKVFDQDQHGGALGIPVASKARWIEFDGNNSVIDGSAGAEGRVSQISTGGWTLVESTYVVNDSDWIGIADDIYTVAQIEEVRAVMFVGDFTTTNLNGPDGNGGKLLIDNVLVEVFKDVTSVTANVNPNPTLSEVTGLLGDYNENDSVDAADYTFWRDRLGDTAALPNDDTPGVGPDDYTRWKTNFGMSIPGGGSLSAAAVPEPSALMLAISMLLGSVAIRRNK